MSTLFGPSRKEIWEKLCQETGADFIKGGFWKGDKVQLLVRNWTISLDIYTVSTGKSHQHYTHIRVPFRNKDGFRFLISRRKIFSDIQKIFGMQDIEIGETEFDRDFIIKANNEEKVKHMLLNKNIRELITIQPKLKFEIKDNEGWFGKKFPEDADVLIFKVHGIIKDTVLLKSLFELFAVTLNYLCESGSASSYDPGVDL
ncbi:MAG: hypothetical protein AB9842_09170 [Bacteroidales bacterium]